MRRVMSQVIYKIPPHIDDDLTRQTRILTTEAQLSNLSSLHTDFLIFIF